MVEECTDAEWLTHVRELIECVKNVEEACRGYDAAFDAGCTFVGEGFRFVSASMDCHNSDAMDYSFNQLLMWSNRYNEKKEALHETLRTRCSLVDVTEKQRRRVLLDEVEKKVRDLLDSGL